MARLQLLLLCLLLGACAPDVAAPRDAGAASAATRRTALRFSEIKVLDGDTVLCDGATVRLLGFDTPEKAAPDRFFGSQEPWATRAENKLRDVLSAARKIEIAYLRGPDKYGRKLAHLYADGVPVGVHLVKAGLAYANVDHYGAQGFEDEANQLREAAKSAAKPEFIEPHKWRAKNALKPPK